MTNLKIGVILANLGTPDSPSPKDISRYLWQFLTDPRVVDLPRCKWYPLLKAIILPLRSKRVAKDYRSIWTEQGSPLMVFTEQQKQGYVCAKSNPIRLGKNVQVWQIDIRDEQDKLCCVSRLTLSIITHD